MQEPLAGEVSVSWGSYGWKTLWRNSKCKSASCLKQEFSSLRSTQHEMVHLKLLLSQIAGPGSDTCNLSDEVNLTLH